MQDDKQIGHNEDGDLKNSAPHLFGMEKQNPFSTPDGYFDELSSKVINRVAEEKQVRQPVWRFIFQPKIAIAASVVAIGLTVATKFVFFNNVDVKEAVTTEELFADLSDEDLEGLTDELFMEDVLTEVVHEERVPFENIEDEEAIIDYLMENNIDIQTLSNEL